MKENTKNQPYEIEFELFLAVKKNDSGALDSNIPTIKSLSPCRVCLASRHTLHLCFKSHHAKMG